MLSLILASVFFVGIHLFVSGTRLRGSVTSAIGEGPYLGLFSLASLGGIVWLSMAYASAPTLMWWGEVPGARYLSLAATLVAFVLAAIGMTSPLPTSMGQEGMLERDESPRGIARVTRHPFLWSVVIWSGMHLVTNGDAASFVLFGSFFVLCLAGPPSIDGKRARKFGASWEAYTRVTSNVPFGAIASGRNQLVLSEIAWWKWLLGVGLWLGVIAFHASLFGVSPLPL